VNQRLFALVAALLLGAATAYAAPGSSCTEAGCVELNLLVAIFTGNIGLVLGLCVTIMGIFMFVKGDTGGAVWTMILGVLITMVPGVYSGLRLIACPIAQSLGGQCGGSTPSGGG